MTLDKTVIMLDLAERERLAWLAEECAEVTKSAMKILRHGYESYNPLIPNAPTNRDDLEKEIGHVLAVLDLMSTEEDIDEDAIEKYSNERDRDIVEGKCYLHYQGNFKNKE